MSKPAGCTQIDVGRMTGNNCRADMAWASRNFWRPVGPYGLEGWELGAWPQVVWFLGRGPNACKVRQQDHGHVTIWTFDTPEHTAAFLDLMFARQMAAKGHLPGWKEGNPIPEAYTGQFSWTRLDAAMIEGYEPSPPPEH